MSEIKSQKSAYDYAELGGLRITLSNLKAKLEHAPDDLAAISWLKKRVEQLNNK
jgi:hypothetical protein